MKWHHVSWLRCPESGTPTWVPGEWGMTSWLNGPHFQKGLSGERSAMSHWPPVSQERGDGAFAGGGVLGGAVTASTTLATSAKSCSPARPALEIPSMRHFRAHSDAPSFCQLALWEPVA